MIRYFAQHPTAANLLMAALMILGLITLPKLQRDTFPVTAPQEVEVRIQYPGASPLDVEDAICARSEEALDTVMNLIEVRCDSRENLAIVTAKMAEGSDMTAFFNDVKANIESINSYPDNVEKPSVEILERVAVVAGVMITSGMSGMDLYAYAEKVKARIQKDRRIAQVRVLGFSEQDILVEVPEFTLQKYGLGIFDLKTIIERQSVNLPAGTLESETGDVLVRFDALSKSVDEFRDIIVIAADNGATVRLGDIAKVSRAFDNASNRIEFNERRAAQLQISKTYQQDSLRVMAAVQENLERERSLAPRGVSLEISQDVTTNIRDRLRILLENGLQGLVLVFLAMWAFFGLRYSFWVSMGLPVSFLASIFVMHLLGYTINMMTMVALLVATGLLMDDAIVISENIAASVDKGINSLQAVVDGTREVFPGVLSSFLTTLMIVGPLAFMSGKIGAVLRYIPVVLIITLAVSLLEAFLILPAHLKYSITHKENRSRSRFNRWFNAKFDALRDRFFAPILSKSLSWPFFSVGLLLALVIVSFAGISSGVLKYRALPELESDVVQARIRLSQGSSMDATAEVVAEVIDALEQSNKRFVKLQPNEEQVVRNITVTYSFNADVPESGAHLATVSADLIPASQRVVTVKQLLKDWRKTSGSIADVQSLTFTDKERGVAGKAIDIRLQGSKLDMLKSASLELQAWLTSFKGVLNVGDDLFAGKQEYHVEPRQLASVLGLTASDIASEVRSAIQGGSNLVIQKGNNAIDVKIRSSQRDLNSMQDLQSLPIPTGKGELIPLSAIVDVREYDSFSRVLRVNGTRTVTIQGALDGDVINARELMGLTKRKFLPELRVKYPGIKVSFVGQGKESAATGSSLTSNLMIGLVGVYMILSFQFRSYVQPIAVLLAIPMGLVGVVVGHLAMGLQLSMPSLVGLATLSGIVVNDSILLVAFIKKQRAAGVPIVEAVQFAAQDRFRAVVLTSLTTIIGLTPLLLETSTQAQFLIPLVASIAFGLLTATVLSLFLIPSIFLVLHELGLLKSVAVMEGENIT